MIIVKKNWWKEYFNGVYLITDARSVCDGSLTSREVDLIESLLGLNKDDRILDLFGGQGRHSLELARRGYRKLTVVDWSGYLIKEGKKTARSEDKKIHFLKKDARATGLKAQSFSVAVVMANSFGYFDKEADDLRVLKEIKRLLSKGGRLLLDLADSGYVKRNLVPFSRHEANKDITVTRNRELTRGLIRVREVVTSREKGVIRDGSYSERIYSAGKITSLLKSLGYKKIAIYKGVSLHKIKKD